MKKGDQVTSVASSVRVQPRRAPVLESVTFASESEMRAGCGTVVSIPRVFGDLKGVLELIGRKVVNPSPNENTRIETCDTEIDQTDLTVGAMTRVGRIGL